MSYGSRTGIAYDLGGLSHLLRAMYIRKEIPFIIIPPTTLKKYFVGKGTAKKMDMILEANKRGANIPFFKRIEKQTVFDDNVCDAYGLCCFLQDYMDGNAIDFENKVEKSWIK